MLRKIITRISLAMTALLILLSACAGPKPAEENPMNNLTRPPLDLAAPAVTATATFSMG
ncbi:MAG: hypothetical protein PHR56_06340 [Dehalococcoidales bacterium]|nr:hypothetical protein [Dehalococcoidales bacterium]